MTAAAALIALDDVRAASVRRDDRVIALQSIQADGSVREWPALNPLQFTLDAQRCGMQRNCQVWIERAGQGMELPFWVDDVRLAPPVESAELSLLRRGFSADKGALPQLVALAERWHAGGEHAAAAWLLAALADADAELEHKALAWLAQEAMLALELHRQQALRDLARGQFQRAAERLGALDLTAADPALRVAIARLQAGVDFAESRLPEAEQRLRAVVALTRQHAPESHQLSVVLNSLAVVIRPQGRLREARRLFVEAMESAHRFAPGSATEIKIRANLGLLERAASDLPAAEAHLREAVRLARALGNQPLLTYDSELNLVLVLIERGRTREAAELLSADQPEDTDPIERELRHARSQQQLAMLHSQQGDAALALRYARAAAGAAERGAPGSLQLANAWIDVGIYATEAGELESAHDALVRALGLHLQIAREGYGAITVLDALARLALRAGDPERAGLLQQTALLLRDRGEHQDWQREYALIQLGRIMAADQPESALVPLAEAVRLAAITGREFSKADALATTGEVLLRLNRPAQARQSACGAVDHIEALRLTSPAGAELRSSFARTAAPVYQSCMDAVLASADTPAALEYYQRERQMLLEQMLADRDLRFVDLPDVLLNRRMSALRELREVASGLEQALSTAERAALIERRDRARQRLRQLDAEAARALPQLARWRTSAQPPPLRAPPATTVLAFAVREDNVLRFVLHADQPPVWTVLPIGADRLRARIRAWRSALLAQEGVEPRLARELHQQLLANVPALAPNLIIVPDGPLHALPFAALLDEGRQRLVQAHAIQLAALLPDPQAKARVTTRSIDLLAVGESASVGERPALPAVEDEMRELAALPWSRVRTLRGTEATLDAVRALGPQARLVHFAVHGINDPNSPMDSALLLHGAQGRAAPLAAWEVFETLRLDADLVILAACDTAPGVRVEDEGWLGLTRAFQFAGAREVVSAQWSVGDRSTARLMSALHQSLASGKAPADALASAQRMLIADSRPDVAGGTRGVGAVVPEGSSSGPKTRAPYHWAAFAVHRAPD